MNLQLFAQERTEKPTPRRRQKARERGQVFSSREFTSALILLVSFSFFKVIGSGVIDRLTEFMPKILRDFLNTEDITNINGLYNILYQSVYVIGIVLVPIMAAIIATIFVTNYIQMGFVLSVEPLTPRLDRLNPIEGFKRIFSRRSIFELLKSIIKTAVIGYVLYNSIIEIWALFPLMMDMELTDAAVMLLRFIYNMGVKASVALLILSLFDYLYQFYEYETSLMMSKQDIKEEFKETEGNPQIKSRIRQVQRQMLRSRMLSDVKKADVVITNPTHLAVALLYDVSLRPAPMVVAKGQDYLAEKIKQIAREHNIAIVENKPLAQVLYKSVEVGDVIPEDLYQAVAEILAFVYSLKERRL